MRSKAEERCETPQGLAVSQGQTVRRMDAAPEPTRMYLRRV